MAGVPKGYKQSPEHVARRAAAMRARYENRSTRTCQSCNTEKDLATEWRKNPSKDLSWAAYCISCETDPESEYRKRRLLNERKAYLKRFHDVTIEWYEERLEVQGGRCAICRRTPEEASVKPSLVVDHDHQSEVRRGLLCDPCNRAIGMLGDDPERLEAAAKYIRDHLTSQRERESHGAEV